MKSKKFMLISVVSILALILSACGGGDKKVELKTTSTYAGTDPGSDIYRSIMDEFMEDNPNVKINDESSSIDERFRASLINDFYSGNEPDAMFFVHGADGQTIVDSGNVVDIETIQEEYPDYASNISDSTLDVLRMSDGKAYAVPITGYWMGIYVNEKLFEEYNLDLPTDWDKLITAIKTFNENDIVPFALALGHIPHFFIEHMFYTHGGVESLMERPNSVDEIPESWIEGLYTLKELYELGAFPKDTNSTTEDEVNLQFQQGEAAMMVNGTWFQGNIPEEDDSGDLVTQDDITLLPFPMHPEGKGTEGIVGGVNGGFYISKNAWEDSDKKDYVVKLVQAHTSTEAISKYAGPETGGVSPDDSVEIPENTGIPLIDKGNAFWLEHRDSYADPAADYMKSDPKNVFYQGLTQVVTGKITPEELLEKVIADKPFEQE